MLALIERSKEIVSAAFAKCQNPVIYFSGGKDSVAMLHLLRFGMGLDIPLIFHREPFMTGKYAFGEAVVRAWGCEAFDYPPAKVTMWHGKGVVAYTNHYQIGAINDHPTYLVLPKNIVEPDEGKPFLCGMEDLIQRPTGLFRYPWDLAFIGHKSADEDQICGPVPLHADFVQNYGAPSAAFPLRHWTHEDVWQYTEENKLPVQKDRYEGREELPDKSANSDYFHACIRCIDCRKAGEMVDCPKYGMRINNVSASIPYESTELPYFGQPNAPSIESKIESHA